jgi:hypothetical protein
VHTTGLCYNLENNKIIVQNVQAEINFVKTKLMEIEREKIEYMRHKFNSILYAKMQKLIYIKFLVRIDSDQQFLN